MKRDNLIGQKFGKLTVLSFAYIKNKRTCWECFCECGNKIVVIGHNLKCHTTNSCGCLKKNNNLIHGMKKTKTYTTWVQIKYRCLNKNSSNYKYYGGRGITVCSEWMEFENFFRDMGERPKGTTIDRIKNNLGYFKENCKWSTPKEQANNRRKNHTIFYRGETKTIAQWAKIFKINPNTIYYRINKGNWSIENALTTPSKRLKY